MATQTDKLKLYKANPATDGNDTFNIDTMLNDNWDKIDEFADGIEAEISNVFNFELWANMPGAIYTTDKNADNSYTTTLVINSIKKAERIEYPANVSGEYITVEKLYRADGTLERTRTLKEYKDGEKYKMEVV